MRAAYLRTPLCLAIVVAGLAGTVAYADYPKCDTTKAAIIDDLSVLGIKDAVATPEYLFDTIVTNWMYDATGTNCNDRAKEQYVERYRIFVDLNQDGHEDVIMSAPISQRGSGGLSYDVCLWTNGNYVCIGDIGGHLSCIHVEHIDECTRVIWTYSHSSASTGAIGTFVVRGWSCRDNRCCHVELGDEGHDPPTVGSQLLDIIAKTATVPLRIEKSETRDGRIRWRKVEGEL
jgi:hypothetical protein